MFAGASRVCQSSRVSLSSGRVRRLAILGSLYVGQGIVYGFGGFILVPTMAAAGVTVEAQAGILALAGLPWVFKLLWGPVLDRFGGLGSGRARGFATVAMVAMAVVLVILGMQPSLSEAPSTVAWLWLLLNLALSLQDVATDALVLDHVPTEERGAANGVLLGGHHVGAEGVGSLGLGLVVVAQGLSAALWVQAGIMVVLALAPWGLPRVPARVDSPEHEDGGGGGLREALAALLRDRSTFAVAVVAALVMSADVITSTVSGQFWVVRLGWSVERLSTTLAPLLLGANIAAFAVATVSVDRLGHGRAAAIGSAMLGALWVGFGLVPSLWTADAFMVVFVVAQALVTAVFSVGLHAALMNSTIPAIRASHFAVLMALLNLPRAAAAPFAPALLAALDFTGLFIAAGLFQVAMAAAVSRVWPSRSS